MTDEQRTAAIGAAVVVLIILIAAFFERRKRKQGANEVLLARVVERNGSAGWTNIIGVLFLASTFFCVGNYYFSNTSDRLITNLLTWIANSAFWGVCLLLNLVTQIRVSTVYRDQPQPERREPTLETPQ